jgi:hypothetical protein
MRHPKFGAMVSYIIPDTMTWSLLPGTPERGRSFAAAAGL